MSRPRSIIKEEQAKTLHSQGISKAEIARTLDVSYITVMRWLNIKYESYFREQYLKRSNTLEGRIAQALCMSKFNARKGNYKPCLATVEEIIKEYDGTCKLCGKQEIKLKVRLHIDHCHHTGKFRGWICKGCNLWLAHLENNKGLLKKVQKYLNYEGSKLSV